MPHQTPSRLVKTTTTVFDIVETIRELDGATSKEVAEHLDLAISTVHDHLITLKHLGYVVKEGHEYQLGLKFLNHGTYALERYDIVTAAQPALDRLVRECQEFIWLFVEEHGRVIAVDRKAGSNAISTVDRVGRTLPIHCTAGGKAILAHLPDERLEEIIEWHELSELTDNTITDPQELEAELAKIRDQGYAINDEEHIGRIRAVATAVIIDGQPIGSVSIRVPKRRMEDEQLIDETAQLVLEAANEIELNLTDHSQADV